MKTIYSPFLFIALYLVLSGCSKKSDPTPVCHLSTLTETSGGWSLTTTYTYDANGRVSTLSKSDNSENDTFSYNAQDQITSITKKYAIFAHTPLTEISTVTYDAKGRVTLITSPSSKTVYEYNSSGQMIKESDYSYDVSSSSFLLSEYTTYEYTSTSTKNYSTDKVYDPDNNLTRTDTYQYDAKPNPESVLFPGFPNPTNNFIQSILANNGGSTYTDNSIYSYNSNGFPTSVSTTETSGSNTVTSTRVFTYTNCK